MDQHSRVWLRWTGVAGIAGAIAYTIGDALLLGNEATAAQFPHLTTYADTRLIQRGARFLASSTERLAAGALVGVFATPLYLAGIWHIFEATKTAGRRWSEPPFFLLMTAFSLAPFVHGSFFYLAEILKTVGQVDVASQPAVIALASRTALWLFVAYGVLVLAALLGFGWLTVAIARGQTMYPRWVALANPLVCILIGTPLDRVLPQPLSLWLSGAGFSLGLLAFFGLSTIVLWSAPAAGATVPFGHGAGRPAAS